MGQSLLAGKMRDLRHFPKRISMISFLPQRKGSLMLLFNIPWELLLFTVPVVWVITRLNIYSENIFGHVCIYGHYRFLNIIGNVLKCSKCLGLWLGLGVATGYFFGNVQENFFQIIAFACWSSLISYFFGLIVYCFESLAGQ